VHDNGSGRGLRHFFDALARGNVCPAGTMVEPSPSLRAGRALTQLDFARPTHTRKSCRDTRRVNHSLQEIEAMSARLKREWLPRNGHTLVIGVVARISGCPNQKELSLDDQFDHAKEVVKEYYEGPVDHRVVATKGKGERLDRPELNQIEKMIRSRELDGLVAEDLGRMVRGTEAKDLCGLAVDHGTRVLAPNDCIDTFDESWEEDAISACRDHVGHNAHTSKRIKHKKMNRFKKFGGATPCEIYGYVKPHDAKTYDDWLKDEGAKDIYSEWLHILQQTLNCSAVADMLNQRGVPVGPHCRRKTWNGAMVRRITRNPLLKGTPGRGFKHTIKHHETGRRIAVKNPHGPVFREYPHLAQWDAADFDAINARLDEANKGCGRKPVNGVDPFRWVHRTRTRFPGQHAVCWYCGRQCVWGGNGMRHKLMCNSARAWRCWNSFGFSGGAAAKAVATALFGALDQLDGLDEQLRAFVEAARSDGGADLARAWEELRRDEEAVAREEQNTRDAIAEYGPKPMFGEKLAELEGRRRDLARRRSGLERRSNAVLDLPGSVVEIRALFERKFDRLAPESYEFGDLLRQVVPELHIYHVRLLDGGHLLPRARATLNLAGIVPDARYVPGFQDALTRVVTLELCTPPQREQIRGEAVRLAAAGLQQREVARRLGVTQPAVTAALALDRMMRDRGLNTPYTVVFEPPGDYPKLRRHPNPKFRFEPLRGYERPPL
jgi:hypothetical protein